MNARRAWAKVAARDFEPPDVSDVPFAVAEDMILDVPVPPSVNRTRKINWAAAGEVEDWVMAADAHLLAYGQFRKAKALKPKGPFELTIILNEAMCNSDPDNIVKVAIDYLRRLELIKDDSPKYARRIVIEWGDAPLGCRMIVRPAASRGTETA